MRSIHEFFEIDSPGAGYMLAFIYIADSNRMALVETEYLRLEMSKK